MDVDQLQFVFADFLPLRRLWGNNQKGRPSRNEDRWLLRSGLASDLSKNVQNRPIVQKMDRRPLVIGIMLGKPHHL